MTGGFTKLFNTILTSSVWQEPDPVRLVWITLLALANKRGEVSAALPGLAHVARVSQSDAEAAVATLSSPDPHSRTKENDGRRIEAMDGGWLILNYSKYRQVLCADERREYLRVKQQEHREKAHMSTNVNTVNTIAEAESREQRAEADKEVPPNPLKGERAVLPYGSGSFKDERTLQYFNTEWVTYRKGLGHKPKDWLKMFTKQAEWLAGYDYHTAKAIIDQSIRNNWRGLFEIKSATKSAGKPQGQPPPPRYNRPVRLPTDSEFKAAGALVAAEMKKFREKLGATT